MWKVSFKIRKKGIIKEWKGRVFLFIFWVKDENKIIKK